VVSGVLEAFSSGSKDVDDFATVLLISGFRDLKSLLLRYRIGGMVPILSPLASVPALQQVLVSMLVERWASSTRLQQVVQRAAEDVKGGKNRAFDLRLAHAFNDADIPYDNSELLYAELLGLARRELGEENAGVDAGSFSDGAIRRNASWAGVSLDLRLIRCGGHNDIPTHSTVAVALMQALGLIDPA
jgi:abhydrolase domain-containing protein 12